MKTVKVSINLNDEAINQNLQKVRELKDLYLMWCVEGSSPADCPEDILFILRDFDKIDNHFLLLTKKIDNQKALLRGEEICYPDVE
jgi:ATP adenylyltransferase/5',5'''-P-1,P-4-tetraphosphate phosphorylase II